jgi:hypothetical protein
VQPWHPDLLSPGRIAGALRQEIKNKGQPKTDRPWDAVAQRDYFRFFTCSATVLI